MVESRWLGVWTGICAIKYICIGPSSEKVKLQRERIDPE